MHVKLEFDIEPHTPRHESAHLIDLLTSKIVTHNRVPLDSVVIELNKVKQPLDHSRTI